MMRRSERIRRRQYSREAKMKEAHYWQVWRQRGNRNRPVRWRLLDRVDSLRPIIRMLNLAVWAKK